MGGLREGTWGSRIAMVGDDDEGWIFCVYHGSSYMTSRRYSQACEVDDHAGDCRTSQGNRLLKAGARDHACIERFSLHQKVVMTTCQCKMGLISVILRGSLLALFLVILVYETSPEDPGGGRVHRNSAQRSRKASSERKAPTVRRHPSSSVNASKR